MFGHLNMIFQWHTAFSLYTNEKDSCSVCRIQHFHWQVLNEGRSKPSSLAWQLTVSLLTVSVGKSGKCHRLATALTTTHWLINTHIDKSVSNSDRWCIVFCIGLVIISETEHDKNVCKQKTCKLLVRSECWISGHFSILQIFVGTRDNQLETGTILEQTAMSFRPYIGTLVMKISSTNHFLSKKEILGIWGIFSARTYEGKVNCLSKISVLRLRSNLMLPLITEDLYSVCLLALTNCYQISRGELNPDLCLWYGWNNTILGSVCNCVIRDTIYRSVI